MKVKLKDCFDDNGNLKFDPYRFDEENETPTRIAMKNLLFTEDGWLTDRNELAKLISENGGKWLWTCSAIGLYHAEIHASATKGSYPTYYYFR